MWKGSFELISYCAIGVKRWSVAGTGVGVHKFNKSSFPCIGAIFLLSDKVLVTLTEKTGLLKDTFLCSGPPVVATQVAL